MGLKAQLAYHGASSVRDLKAKLGTPHDSLRKLIQVAALHKAFKSLGGATGALGLPAGSVSFAADGAASRDYRGGRLRTLGDEQPRPGTSRFACGSTASAFGATTSPTSIRAATSPISS